MNPLTKRRWVTATAVPTLLAATVLAAPAPSYAQPQDVPAVSSVPFGGSGGPAAGPAAAAGTPQPATPAPHPAGQDAKAATAGATNVDRQIALAATWAADPTLTVPQPGDSAKTLAARKQLAEVAAQLRKAIGVYDQDYTTAQQAQQAADAANAQLAAAQVAQVNAVVRYTTARDTLAAVVHDTYVNGPVTTLDLFISPHAGQDLSNLSLAKQVGVLQANAAQQANEAADQMRAATLHVAAASKAADESLAAADTALAQADRTRRQVLTQVEAARTLLDNSTLADSQARVVAEAAQAQQAGAAGRGVLILATPSKGGVVFPLPPGTSFVDQNNWGYRSSHWASIHTGDDFSTSCGTPVLAATDGTIEIRTDQSWAGPWLVLDNTGPGHLSTWYAHMEALTVTNGEQVKAGQQIGFVGAEGNATGCHLHFEYHPLGGSIYEDTTDPRPWLIAMHAYPEGH